MLAGALLQDPRVTSEATTEVYEGAACKVYVSEGRNQRLLQELERACAACCGAQLADVFVDGPYNRTGFTLAGAPECQASHPRLGSVDHISVQPLSWEGGLAEAAHVATEVGRQLGNGGAGIPVLLYGHAQPQRKSLADTRRALGYFAGSGPGRWAGLPPAPPEGFKPDFGPGMIDARHGVILIGATPWVTNFNVLLDTSDMPTVKRIARAVSSRGGGIAGVEAMALAHSSGIEVACNLLGGQEELQDAVLKRIEESARGNGIRIASSYRIGHSMDEYAKAARDGLQFSRVSDFF